MLLLETCHAVRASRLSFASFCCLCFFRCACRSVPADLARSRNHEPSGSLFLFPQRFSVSVQCFAVSPLVRACLSLKAFAVIALSLFASSSVVRSRSDHGVLKVPDACARVLVAVCAVPLGCWWLFVFPRGPDRCQAEWASACAPRCRAWVVCL